MNKNSWMGDSKTHYKIKIINASIMPTKKHSNTSTKYIQPTFSFLYKPSSSFTWRFCFRILYCRTTSNLHIFFNSLLCGPRHNLNPSLRWLKFIFVGTKISKKVMEKCRKKLLFWMFLKGKNGWDQLILVYLDQPQDPKIIGHNLSKLQIKKRVPP